MELWKFILLLKNFTQDEMIKQRLVVFENTIHAMDDILKVMERCSVKFSDPARK
ncbi:hypothetical protein WUBG_14378, partial [Wuchereria bancrofti]